ncbi:Uncharacterised protein [uncultured archaeon]|nr:Uncharacterised protein [uncultured archaeon]
MYKTTVKMLKFNLIFPACLELIKYDNNVLKYRKFPRDTEEENDDKSENKDDENDDEYILKENKFMLMPKTLTEKRIARLKDNIRARLQRIGSNANVDDVFESYKKSFELLPFGKQEWKPQELPNEHDETQPEDYRFHDVSSKDYDECLTIINPNYFHSYIQRHNTITHRTLISTILHGEQRINRFDNVDKLSFILNLKDDMDMVESHKRVSRNSFLHSCKAINSKIYNLSNGISPSSIYEKGVLYNYNLELIENDIEATTLHLLSDLVWDTDEYQIALCGSTLLKCGIMRKSSFKLKDIDLAVYIKGASYEMKTEDWVEKFTSVFKMIKEVVNNNTIETAEVNKINQSHYELKLEHITIDVFRSTCSIPKLISNFHLPAVRQWYVGYPINNYNILPSFLYTMITNGQMPVYQLMKSKHLSAFDTIEKYEKRGYKLLMSKNEKVIYNYHQDNPDDTNFNQFRKLCLIPHPNKLHLSDLDDDCIINILKRINIENRTVLYQSSLCVSQIIDKYKCLDVNPVANKNLHRMYVPFINLVGYDVQTIFHYNSEANTIRITSDSLTEFYNTYRFLSNYLKCIVIDDPVYSLTKLEEFVEDREHMNLIKRLKELYILDKTVSKVEDVVIKNKLTCKRINSDGLIQAIKHRQVA